eukprot:TRINITY_DN1817_c0_g1_i3.p1 TRINITY_DN1817_c0_g1~~TRINITY_DN1817_c0_g1_i3.p1  ORF type:complete len:425 (-),score=135.18 TRINITY_DN1817_c0_g1_i3:176-1450(-)
MANQENEQFEPAVYNVNGTRFEVNTRYKPIKPIGKGAYGLVCSAHDKVKQENVAIKKIPKVVDDVVDGKRVLREIKLMRFCEHENIASVRDVLPPAQWEKFEDIYIVSDLMDTDLHQIIRSKQPLSDDHVQYFLYQILRGLKYMHSANILHRDLKPGNLLVNANCDLRICDLGLARVMDPADVLRDMTEYVITRWYRPPELLLSCPGYTKSIDVWSVGCILAELLTRLPLFPGKNHVDQLNLITSLVGAPNEQELALITNEQALKFMKSMPPKPRCNLATRFPNATPDAVDLLDKMLQFDPRKRITVSEALAHPYLATYHDPENEPVSSRVFEADFEGYEMDKATLCKLLGAEVLHFHPHLEQEAHNAAGPHAKRQRVVVTESLHDIPVVVQANNSTHSAPPPAAPAVQPAWLSSSGEAKPYGQ